jgi:hypothetical protein
VHVNRSLIIAIYGRTAFLRLGRLVVHFPTISGPKHPAGGGFGWHLPRQIDHRITVMSSSIITSTREKFPASLMTKRNIGPKSQHCDELRHDYEITLF